MGTGHEIFVAMEMLKSDVSRCLQLPLFTGERKRVVRVVGRAQGWE